jgi:tRNA(fMet)-specific endonuclease VapC
VNYMLDTNMVSYILRKDSASSKRLAQLAPRHKIFLSAVTYFELRNGANRKHAPKGLRAAITEFVSRLSDVLPWTKDAAEQAARIHGDLSRRGEAISLIDAMLAGHATATNCTFVTHNVKEFERVGELELEDWTLA